MPEIGKGGKSPIGGSRNKGSGDGGRVGKVAKEGSAAHQVEKPKSSKHGRNKSIGK